MDGRVTRNNFGALGLIAAGVLLLAFQVFGINFWDLMGGLWPLFVVLPGVAFLSAAYFGDRKASGLVFPGTIITGTGLILLYQNMTGNWESWAYIWTLYPAFVGAALLFNGTRNNSDGEVRTGRQMMQWSAVAFVIGFVFFEFFIFGGNGGLIRYLLPASLMGAGGYLLLNRGGEREKSKREYFNPPPAPRKMKPSYGSSAADINPDLRRRIDEAIREDDLV